MSFSVSELVSILEGAGESIMAVLAPAELPELEALAAGLPMLAAAIDQVIKDKNSASAITAAIDSAEVGADAVETMKFGP